MDEFDAFVRSRSAALLRSAYLLTGDQYLAEDLVQSALARTHRAWGRLHERGNAEAYTRKVMYHLQVSWWRRRRPEAMPGDLPEPHQTGDHADQTSLRMTLRAALLKLPDRQRAVLVLRYFEDRTESEAADLLGVSTGTVKSQTFKALARLRDVAPELADLAGQARNADLRDRALRTSRRLGAQRAATASAVAIAVLAGLVGIALALRPGAAGPGPVPGTSPTPAQRSSPAPSATETVLKGTRWYVAKTPAEYVIHAVTGTRDTIRARIPADGNDAHCVGQTIGVSPGGRRLAWAEGTDDVDCTLKVADVDGGRARTVATGVLGLGARALIWKGDDQLVVTKGGAQHLITIATGADTPLPASEVVEAYSPDGSKVARTAGQQRFADGRAYRYTPPAAAAEHHDGWSARGLSADGRYVAAGWNGTDPSRQDITFTIVDTTTGRSVSLPGDGSDNVLFTAGGLVLVHRPGRTAVFDAQLRHQGDLQDPGLQTALLTGFDPGD